MKTYLRTAWRNLAANRTYSIVNIVGLGVSLAASILLLLWVQDELSFDMFHSKADRIYRVSAAFRQNGKEEVWTSTPAPLATAGKLQVPEIADACRVSGAWQLQRFRYKDKKFFSIDCGLADTSFFSMFDFQIIQGDKRNLFPDKQSVVMSETTAEKFFGKENPIGKTIIANDNEQMHVTGIMKDIPENSSIRYSMVLPFSRLESNYDGNDYWKSLNEDWGNYNYDTYFLFKKPESASSAAIKLTRIHQKAQPEDFTKNLTYILLPLKKVHLYDAQGKEQGMATVRIFFLVAVIILFIACINYVNLVTARAIKRAKEISVRKIAGAGNWHLFLQFMCETLLLILVSLVVATMIIYLTIPLYNQISAKQIQFSFFNGGVLLTYLSTLLTTLILAGIYPAVNLLSLDPLESFKGKVLRAGKSITLRKVLVVIQFTLSVILVISTIILSRQLRYIREKNLGYDKENVIALKFHKMADHYDAVRSNLLNQPEIVDVTYAGDDIMNLYSSSGDAEWDGKTALQQTFMINQLAVDQNFIKVMNIQLKDGPGFSGTPADSSHFILNETAIKEMGIKDPIGKRFKFHDVEGNIAGVVKDFHFQNLHNQIKPMILFYRTWKEAMYVRTTGKDASRAINELKSVWKQYNGDIPFEYKFLDDSFNETYKSDIRVGLMFNIFACITILISCLGLFGLITYTAESKVKEIGIRKTLGAGISDIVKMLSTDLIKLVLISCAISFPLAWWALNKLLDDYAYKTNIDATPFLLAAFLTLLIAQITIGFKAVKASLANPVRSLRTE